MQGMSERQYAAHVGLSRGAIQKAKDGRAAGAASPTARSMPERIGCAAGGDDRPVEAARPLQPRRRRS